MATVYTQLFRKECEGRLGITRDLVRDTIAQPDKEQRLASQGLTLIMYSKKFPKSDDFLVVNTHVQGQDLMVDLAFRAKKALVEEAKTASPFQLMQALALKFGLPIKVGDRESRFIYNEVIPVSSTDIKKVLRIQNPDGRPLVSSMWVRMLQNSMGPMAQCAMLFCIDTQAYSSWAEN